MKKRVCVRARACACQGPSYNPTFCSRVCLPLVSICGMSFLNRPEEFKDNEDKKYQVDLITPDVNHQQRFKDRIRMFVIS